MFLLSDIVWIWNFASLHLGHRKKTRMWANAQCDGWAAQSNIGGALCSTPQSLADAHYRVLCNNAAKTRNPLKLAGVPKTPERISAVIDIMNVCRQWAEVRHIVRTREGGIAVLQIFLRFSIRALVAKI